MKACIALAMFSRKAACGQIFCCFAWNYAFCWAYTVKAVKDPLGGLGQFAVIMLKVWLRLPLYLVQHYQPKPAPSCPLSTTLWAALFIERRAVPPNYFIVLGGKVLLWAQLTCWCSQHSFVWRGSLLSFSTRRQSIFISVNPKTLKSHLVMPCLMISSFILYLFVRNLPIFWKLILNMFLSFNFILSPKSSCTSGLFHQSHMSSPSLLSEEGTSPSLLTTASNYSGVSGGLHLWVVGHFRWLGRSYFI